MQNNFCDYETSKMLKELGFDEMCTGYYPPDKELFITLFQQENRNSKYPHLVHAPLWQQVEQWLWEQKGRWIQVSESNANEFGYTIQDVADVQSIKYGFKSPITARTEGIREAVKWLKKSK